MSGKERFDLENKRVYVAGHRGMVGSALIRRLKSEKCEIIVADRSELNLLSQDATLAWMSDMRPDVVFHAAAKVGGIQANSTHPGQFIYENLTLATNVVHAAHVCDVKKLIYLGSSCIYPRLSAQPIKESALLSGPLEPTNEAYAIAKIAGVKMCEAYRKEYQRDFITVMPTNLYGLGDNYNPETSHVPAALIHRFHQAKRSRKRDVTVWGTGEARREFLFADDVADACIFLAKEYSADETINLGTGTDITIRQFAALVAEVVGYRGEIHYDCAKPEGTPRKLLDVSKLAALGWTPKTRLRDGLKIVYREYQEQVAD